MSRIRRELAKDFLASEEAAVATEYALLIGLIALAIFGAVTAFGQAVYNKLWVASAAALFGS